MILHIVISEHLRESPLERVEPWSCAGLMKAGDSITGVQWLLSHDLADSNRWTSMRKSLLEHAQLCSCSCLIQVKPSQTVSDYYLQDHEKIITEHLWWSHLPFSKTTGSWFGCSRSEFLVKLSVILFARSGTEMHEHVDNSCKRRVPSSSSTQSVVSNRHLLDGRSRHTLQRLV